MPGCLLTALLSSTLTKIGRSTTSGGLVAAPSPPIAASRPPSHRGQRPPATPVNSRHMVRFVTHLHSHRHCRSGISPYFRLCRDDGAKTLFSFAPLADWRETIGPPTTTTIHPPKTRARPLKGVKGQNMLLQQKIPCAWVMGVMRWEKSCTPSLCSLCGLCDRCCCSIPCTCQTSPPPAALFTGSSCEDHRCQIRALVQRFLYAK